MAYFQYDIPRPKELKNKFVGVASWWSKLNTQGYACDPSKMPSWNTFIDILIHPDEEWEFDYSLSGIPKTLDLLRLYIASANGDDSVIPRLYAVCRRAAHVALHRNRRVLARDKASLHIELEKSLKDILSADAITRVDKVVVIWKFIRLVHHSGTILDFAYGEPAQMANYLLFPYLGDVVREVLDCLAGEK